MDRSNDQIADAAAVAAPSPDEGVRPAGDASEEGARQRRRSQRHSLHMFSASPTGREQSIALMPNVMGVVSGELEGGVSPSRVLLWEGDDDATKRRHFSLNCRV